MTFFASPKSAAIQCSRVNLRNHSALSFHDKRSDRRAISARETRIRRRRRQNDANTMRLRVSACPFGSIGSKCVDGCNKCCGGTIRPTALRISRRTIERASLIRFHIIERSIFSENRADQTSFAFVRSRIYSYVQCQDNMWTNNRDTKHRRQKPTRWIAKVIARSAWNKHPPKVEVKFPPPELYCRKRSMISVSRFFFSGNYRHRRCSTSAASADAVFDAGTR